MCLKIYENIINNSQKLEELQPKCVVINNWPATVRKLEGNEYTEEFKRICLQGIVQKEVTDKEGKVYTVYE